MSLFTKNIKVKRLNDFATLPRKAHVDDACFDMWATSKIESTYYIQYGTGIAMEIPDGWVGLIFPRSSVTKEDLMLKNSVGVIDSGYRGEISFRFIKAVNDSIKRTLRSGSRGGGSLEPYIEIQQCNRDLELYKVGDKIGQIMFLELPKVKLTLVDELADSNRGQGGYGSSGKT